MCMSLNLDISESHSVMSDSTDMNFSMALSRPEYWSGWPFPSPGDLPNPGLLYCKQILYQLSHKGNPNLGIQTHKNPSPLSFSLHSHFYYIQFTDYSKRYMAVCKEAVLSVPAYRQDLAYTCHINYHDASKTLSIVNTHTYISVLSPFFVGESIIIGSVPIQF